jgi:tetratricopeptide (TPR) repeat protein
MATPRKRYQFIGKLGEGGMGAVWIAHDRLTGQRVALKQVKATVENAESDTLANTHLIDMRRALAQEFKTLSSLRHPHIVSVLDYGFDGGLPYFTMELLENAQSLLEAAPALRYEQQIEMLAQTLQALAYLHRRGILHRDLKPANVLVFKQEVRVVDFGLAVVNSFANPGFAGTLAYIAPEVLQGFQSSIQSDLYAVGVIAYEIFAGRHPFWTDDATSTIRAVLSDPPDWVPLESNPYITNWVIQLLSKNPEDRYPDANSALTALMEAAGIPLPPETVTIRESYLQAASFVGRETEVGWLTTALRNAIDCGKGSLWLVGGESGVGKSRLLDELRTQAMIDGALVLRGGAVQGGGLPYQMWREPARRLALTSNLDPLEASALKEIVPDVEMLTEQPISELAPLTEHAGMQRLFAALYQCLSQQTQPLLLILEDAQWDAGEGLEMVRRLQEALGHLPVMAVMSYRDDELPGMLDEFPGANHVKLSRLNRSDIAQLSTAMLGEAGSASGVLELLERETEGNAFFIVEVVRALAEIAGEMEKIGVTTLPEQVFTGGVRRVVQARLSRVPEDARDWLRMAAILGRELDFRLMEERLEWLTACQDAAVLEVTDGRWRFAHDKLREQVLQDLSEEDRHTLHRHAAEAVELAYPDDANRAAILAGHWREAGDSLREADYSRLAGEKLLAISNFQAALPLLERALVLKHLPAERAKLMLKMGHAHLRLSNYIRAAQVYEMSLELHRAVGDPQGIANSLLGLSEVAKWRNDYDALKNYQDEAVVMCRAIDDQAGMAACASNLGILARTRGDYDAEMRYQQHSLSIYIDLQQSAGIAECLSNLSASARMQGRFDEAITYVREAQAVCDSVGDRWGVARALNELGYIARLMGDVDSAALYYVDSVAIFKSTGDRWGIASGLTGLGYVAWMQGDLPVAARYLEESLLLCREIGDQWGEAACQAGLGHTAVRNGDVMNAEVHFREALRIALAIPVVQVMLEAVAGLATCASRRGDLEQAATLIEMAKNHPGATQEVWSLTDPLMNELKMQMPNGSLWTRKRPKISFESLLSAGV